MRFLWLHLSVELLRVQRALSPNREQPEQMQVESEDSPRQDISYFWSNSPIDKKIMLEVAGLFSVCVHLTMITSVSWKYAVLAGCWYIRVRKWKRSL